MFPHNHLVTHVFQSDFGTQCTHQNVDIAISWIAYSICDLIIISWPISQLFWPSWIEGVKQCYYVSITDCYPCVTLALALER